MTAALRAAALLVCLAAPAGAHPLAPVLLDLRENENGTTSLLWKTPLARPAGADIRPVLPDGCEAVAPLEALEENDARVQRGTLRCAGGWVGRTLGVTGLDAGDTNALVRVSLADGRLFRALLSPGQMEVTVPAAPSRLAVFRDYLLLGVEHLVTGLDHLLFVLGLVLLVRGGRLLLWTVTAFTAGHSVTLAAAVLGVVNVPQAPVEVLIAVSIAVLAAEIGSSSPSRLARRPWLAAGGFGLLHGLGFAGALASAGLPAGEIPLALLAFNVGIELGQIAVVAAALALALAVRNAGLPLSQSSPVFVSYGIGILAGRWIVERAVLSFFR